MLRSILSCNVVDHFQRLEHVLPHLRGEEPGRDPPLCRLHHHQRHLHGPGRGELRGDLQRRHAGEEVV